MFADIPQNVWRHSTQCLATFPGIFDDTPRNVWQHSPKRNIPPIPRVPCIPFLAPVFLVLYIAVCVIVNWKKFLMIKRTLIYVLR